MLVKKITFFGWVLMFGAILCAAPAFAADQTDLAARAATWEKEYNAGNFAAVAALYSSDGCRMPPNQETVRGTEAITNQLKTGRDQGIAKIKIGVTSTEMSGDMAYGTGTYEITGPDGKHVDHGKWMNVSKKVDGGWKIHCDIWNSDMAMPAAATK